MLKVLISSKYAPKHRARLTKYTKYKLDKSQLCVCLLSTSSVNTYSILVYGELGIFVQAISVTRDVPDNNSFINGCAPKGILYPITAGLEG